MGGWVQLMGTAH